jgi:hypothetical protein
MRKNIRSGEELIENTKGENKILDGRGRRRRIGRGSEKGSRRGGRECE